VTIIYLMLGVCMAGKPFPCDKEQWDRPVASRPVTFIDWVHFEQRVLRPALMHVGRDLCRCMPVWRRKWPSMVKAYLVTDPNRGRTRVEYTIESSSSVTAGRMLTCMGQPVLTFEPIHFVSDIIRPDGSRGKFPRYPIFVAFDGADAGKSRLRKRLDSVEDQ